METNSPADETQGEPGDQAETNLPAKVKRVGIYRLAFILAGSLVLIYFAWRISEDQRRLSQLEQANQVLQEDMEDYQQRLKITAGQLDMMLSAITQARMQRDSGQKALREMEDRVAESRLAREALEEQALAYRVQIEYLSHTLVQVETALEEAANLPDYRYPGSYERVAEFIARAYPAQSEILIGMVDTLGDTKWKFAGSDPGEGLDSEGMAVYLLVNCGLTDDPAAVERGQFTENLERADQPEVGDLVQYEDEYYMFYFLDQEGSPFVVGMTPYGLQLFRFEFKEVVQIFRVPHREGTRCTLTER